MKHRYPKKATVVAPEPSFTPRTAVLASMRAASVSPDGECVTCHRPLWNSECRNGRCGMFGKIQEAAK